MSYTNKSKIPSIRPASVGARGALPQRTMSPAARAATTPTGTSRLPRRPQSDKPLPSPPVAQLLDANSPPKASRTLVDAFTPSPTLKEWPVMRPENIPPRLSSKRSSLPARSPINSRSQSSFNGDEGTRVKRLSWHSSGSGSSSGTGPILTISGDADAVILGQRDSIPAVPAIPTVLPERTTQPRSFGALTSRISKATTSRASLTTATASPVSSTTELTANGSPVVKISPIRSMQPPRQSSLDANSPKSPSSLSSTFTGATTINKTSAVISSTERSISPISDRSATPTPGPKPPAPPLRDAPAPPLRDAPAPPLRDAPAPPLQDAPELPVRSVEAHQEPPEEKPEPEILPESDDFLSVSKVRKNASALQNASPLLVPTDLLSNDDSTINVSTAELSSPSLPQAKHSRDTVRTQDPSKPRALETAISISIDSPLGRGTPKSYPSRRQPYTPVVSSSPEEDSALEVQNKETVATRVKAKRSIRGMFSREKTRAKTPETVASKQGFMSATRSSLAKVMRDSKSLSKVHLPRKTEPKSETEPDCAVTKKSSRPGIFAAFNDEKAIPIHEAIPERRSHANEMLHDMVDRIDAQPEDSPERLRHVQIAECIILAAEYSRNANISALEAKKSARDAEIHADRAQLEFTRLHRLLDGTDVDAQSMRLITSLFTRAQRDGSGEETHWGLLSGMRTAR